MITSEETHKKSAGAAGDIRVNWYDLTALFRSLKPWNPIKSLEALFKPFSEPRAKAALYCRCLALMEARGPVTADARPAALRIQRHYAANGCSGRRVE